MMEVITTIINVDLSLSISISCHCGTIPIADGNKALDRVANYECGVDYFRSVVHYSMLHRVNVRIARGIRLRRVSLLA